MKKKYFGIILCLVSINLLGQNTIARGVELLKDDQKAKALAVFNDILARRATDIEANYYAGLIHYLDENYDKAIEHLSIAATKNFRSSKTHLGILDDSKYLLSNAYFATYRFSLAVELLEEMQANPESHPFETPFVVDKTLEKARIGERLLRGYNPNEIVFVDSVMVDLDDILKYYPQNSNIGYLAKIEVDSVGNKAFEFLSGKRDMKIFAKLDTLLHFDLYRSNRYLSGWSNEQPLGGNLNTNHDENYPFLLPDGITLYFASNNPQESLGGYDIFVSNTNSAGDFLKPRNAGMPFNSPYNDYLLVIDERQNIGYFVSDRYMPKGKVTVYTFEYGTKSRISDTDVTEEEKRLSALQIVIDSVRQSQVRAANSLVINTQDTETEFCFVIADGKVYLHYSDFREEDAKLKFIELQALKREIEIAEQRLAEYRKHFSQSKNSDDRYNLGNTIKEQELALKHLKDMELSMAKEVRRLELILSY